MNENHLTSETNESNNSVNYRINSFTKAGLQHADKAKVNAVVHELSKGSKYYKNEEKKVVDIYHNT